jgi:plastocyanin
MSTYRRLRLPLIAIASACLAFAITCSKDEGGGGKSGGAKKRKTFGERPVTDNGTGEENGDNGNTPQPTNNKKATYKVLDSVENAGAVKGTVTYKGAKTMGNYQVDKDTEVCTSGGKPDESLIVSDGKLRNAVVSIDGISQGKKWDSEAVTVDNKECVFAPRMQIAPAKGTIIAKNSDPVLHNTNLVLKMNGTGKTLANIALPKKDQTVEKKLKKEGMVSVTCDVHKWMQGWVFVSPTPYAAVTGDDGAFSMGDVPPGEYDAKVWHETLGEKQAKVKVEAGGEATLDFEYTDG